MKSIISKYCEYTSPVGKSTGAIMSGSTTSSLILPTMTEDLYSCLVMMIIVNNTRDTISNTAKLIIKNHRWFCTYFNQWPP